MATKLCTSLLDNCVSHELYLAGPRVILPTWIPYQSSAFCYDELHSPVVILGELDGFGISRNFIGGDEKSICKVVVRGGQCRIGSSENRFDCTSVHSVSSNNEIATVDFAIG